MKGFRVDPRDFKPGEKIPPHRKSYVKDNDKKKEIKDKVTALLEKRRPQEKPDRETILMVFDKEINAKLYKESSGSANSKIYEVEYDETKVLHVGCLEKVEKIFSLFNCDSITDEIQAEAEEIADEYWAEKDICIPEVFLNFGIAISKIDDAKNSQLEAIKKNFGYTFKREED